MNATIDCARAVPSPVDASPIRSPQAVHTALLPHFRGLDIVEIGTRNGDGMACFARVAQHSTAIEIDKEYCNKLELQSAILQSEHGARFAVHCADYRTASQVDADVFTWWQQAPHLVNLRVLTELRRRQLQGSIRPTAVAVMLFDRSWEADMKSMHHLSESGLLRWKEHVTFNETWRCSESGKTASLIADSARMCLKRGTIRDSRMCKQWAMRRHCHRAQGSFVIAGVRLDSVRVQTSLPGTDDGRNPA